jgi:hypothetical protein
MKHSMHSHPVSAWNAGRPRAFGTPRFSTISWIGIEALTPVMEEFVLKIYGIHDHSSLDAARKDLFFHKGRTFMQLPPGSDAFHLHLLRAAYQVCVMRSELMLK